jgi:hypothetical protein
VGSEALGHRLELVLGQLLIGEPDGAGEHPPADVRRPLAGTCRCPKPERVRRGVDARAVIPELVDQDRQRVGRRLTDARISLGYFA